MKTAAAELGVAIVWGGDWKSFKDGPHFELDKKVYPA
jgi:peptidoglycan L-alanyl-D-glutamate endopeptidase CwlK